MLMLLQYGCKIKVDANKIKNGKKREGIKTNREQTKFIVLLVG